MTSPHRARPGHLRRRHRDAAGSPLARPGPPRRHRRSSPRRRAWRRLHRSGRAPSCRFRDLGARSGARRDRRTESASTRLGRDGAQLRRSRARLSALRDTRCRVQRSRRIILGRGSFTESFPLFGYPLDQYEMLFEERLDLFAASCARSHGPARDLGRPTRASLEKTRVFPTTEPGLKVWIGVGGSQESVVRAAQYQLPLTLAIIGGDPRRLQPYVELYKQALARMGTGRAAGWGPFTGAHCGYRRASARGDLAGV